MLTSLSLAKVLDHYGAADRAAARTCQPPLAGPRKVNQVVSIEMSDLQRRSPFERLTPNVTLAMMFKT